MKKLLLLLCSIFFLQTGFVFADQSNLYSPTTGTVSGLSLTNNYNNAIKALTTCNSGASAPVNAIGGAPLEGQCWLDTSVARRKLKVFDGGQWLTLAQYDNTAHILFPVIGGGSGTIASAATTDLGSAAEGFITVTGTTGISSFGATAATGSVKIIKFAASLALTYNATTMILPGATNIQTVAGDTATAVALGAGNWQVVSYQRSSGNSSITVGTVVSPTAVSLVDTTGIPTTVKKITVMLNGISTTGLSSVILRIGTGGVVQTTGYSNVITSNWDTSAAVASGTTGFQTQISSQMSTSQSLSGSFVLQNQGGNRWFVQGNFNDANYPYIVQSTGFVTLSGPLDIVRFMTINGTDTFDAGSISLNYEG